VSGRHGRELDFGDEEVIAVLRPVEYEYAVAAQDRGDLVVPGGGLAAREADPLQVGQLMEPDLPWTGQLAGTAGGEQNAHGFLHRQYRVKTRIDGKFADERHVEFACFQRGKLGGA